MSFKAVDSILERKIRAANNESLNVIIEGILDIENLAEVEKLFR